ARVLYLMANFVNDVARSNKLFTSLIEKECAGFSLDDRTPQSLLTELDEAILAYDVPRATAIADAYLRSGADRKAYQATVAIAADGRRYDGPRGRRRYNGSCPGAHRMLGI